MAIIEKPLAKIERKAITIRMPQPIVLELHRYAAFLGGSLDYIVVEALKLVFRKDTQFREWLKQNPIGTAPSANVQAGTAGPMPASTMPLADATRAGIRPREELSVGAGLKSPSRITEGEAVSNPQQLRDRVASGLGRKTE